MSSSVSYASNSILAMFICLAVHVRPGICYITGPPSSSCSSMTPGHGQQAQDHSSSSYNLVLSSNTYTSGSQITVTLIGTSGATFKGFFIQARTNPSDYSTAQGSFTADQNFKKPCGEKGITHNEDSVKTSKVVTWTALSNDVGNITFVYTVVQEYNTYWVRLEHDMPVTWDDAITTPSTTQSSTVSESSSMTSSTVSTTQSTTTEVSSATTVTSCWTLFLFTIMICLF